MTNVHDRLAKHSTALAVLNGIAAGGVNRISIKGSAFTLIAADGEKNEVQTRYLDVVILVGNPNVSKQYFAGAYDPTKDAGPDCFSHNGVGPSSQCSKPQHHECATCPMNQWGTGKKSDGTPSDGKACSDRKLLAVIPTAKEYAGKAYQLNVPTTSLRNLYTYVKDLCKTVHAGGHPMEPYHVITRLTFDSTKPGQVLIFTRGQDLQEAHLNYVADLLDSGQTDELISIGDKPKVVLPASKPAAQIAVSAQHANSAPTAATRIAAAREAQATQERPKVAAPSQPAAQSFASPEPMTGDLDELLSASGFGFGG
jgi:hypothetical protein